MSRTPTAANPQGTLGKLWLRYWERTKQAGDDEELARRAFYAGCMSFVVLADHVGQKYSDTFAANILEQIGKELTDFAESADDFTPPEVA